MTNNHHIWKGILLLASFVIFSPVQKCYAEILFNTSFDIPDWHSKEKLTGEQDATVLNSTDAPSGFSRYRSSRGQLSSLGEQTFTIDNRNNRQSGSGKALTIYYEMLNDWTGGSLDLWLGKEGHDEIYIRWWLLYQKGFRWRTASDSAINKWFRIMSCVDLADGTNPQDMYKTPVSRPDWDDPANTIPLNNEGKGGKQGVFLFSMQNISGAMGFDKIFVNLEGKPGDLADDAVKFDNNARWLWKETNGVFVPGSYSWSSDPSGDWQGDGKWHMYEVHMKMNDIGKDNFIFEFFVDGKLKGKVSKLVFRKDSRTKFNYIMMADNFYNSIFKLEPGGGPPSPPNGEQYEVIDDITIYTPVIPTDQEWNSSPQDGRLPLPVSPQIHNIFIQ